MAELVAARDPTDMPSSHLFQLGDISAKALTSSSRARTEHGEWRSACRCVRRSPSGNEVEMSSEEKRTSGRNAGESRRSDESTYDHAEHKTRNAPESFRQSRPRPPLRKPFEEEASLGERN